MKLELKHLAPYLPYGLKLYIEHLGFDIKPYEWELTLDQNLKEVLENQNKPILRPLSDLLKELEFNGENFTPIIELARIHNKHLPKVYELSIDDWSGLTSLSTETKQYNAHYIVKTSNMGDLSYVFSYWEKLKRFSIQDRTRRLSTGVSNQLDMFNKLFEWHFDVFGLIEKGLAIDINTLKQ